MFRVGPHWMHIGHILETDKTRDELKSDTVKIFCPYCSSTKYGVTSGMIVDEAVKKGKEAVKKRKEAVKKRKEAVKKGKKKRRSAKETIMEDWMQGVAEGARESVDGGFGTLTDLELDVYSDPEMQNKWWQVLGYIPLDHGVSMAETRKQFDSMEIRRIQRQQREKHHQGL